MKTRSQQALAAKIQVRRNTHCATSSLAHPNNIICRRVSLSATIENGNVRQQSVGELIMKKLELSSYIRNL